MELTILEVLYVAIIVFISIIWTLLSIALFRLLKVLKVVVEITDYYNKLKQILGVYSKAPEIFKEKLKDTFSSKKD